MLKNFKGTPGEWRIRPENDGFTSGIFVENEEGWPVANTMFFCTDKDTNEQHKEWDKHNAILLAASKKLAEALQEMVEALERWGINENGPSAEKARVALSFAGLNNQ